jgi:hypothetical protein
MFINPENLSNLIFTQTTYTSVNYWTFISTIQSREK